MARVVVIHRDPLEAAARAGRLRELGVEAQPYVSLGTRGFREIRATMPDAIVIDLTRAPSYGKAIGALLRENKTLRAIPLVFIAGEPEKTAAVKDVLPDAVYAPWDKITSAIERAVARPPKTPVPPRAPDRSIAQKLGIGQGSKVAMLFAPDGFALELPEAATVSKRPDAADVVMVWTRSAASLSREFPKIAAMMQKGRRVWLLWPKRTSDVKTDLTMPRVREMAIAHGLIDYKVCAVDATWSGMAVGPRRR